jgi:hypothetical protein
MTRYFTKRPFAETDETQQGVKMDENTRNFRLYKVSDRVLTSPWLAVALALVVGGGICAVDLLRWVTSL